MYAAQKIRAKRTERALKKAESAAKSKKKKESKLVWSRIWNGVSWSKKYYLTKLA